jgi:hypothetical protein
MGCGDECVLATPQSQESKSAIMSGAAGAFFILKNEPTLNRSDGVLKGLRSLNASGPLKS